MKENTDPTRNPSDKKASDATPNDKSTERERITLVPYGGLANRLKAICSAIALARQYSRPLEIIWFTDEGLNCPSSRLFTLNPRLANEGITIREATPMDWFTHDRPRKSNLYITYPFLLLNYDRFIPPKQLKEMIISRPMEVHRHFRSNERIMLVCCWYLTEEEGMFDVLEPSVEVVNALRSQLSGWTANVVGVHIRRTDHLVSIRESPTDLFIKRMQKMIEDDPTVHFYIATDLVEERERLCTIFEGRTFAPKTIPARNTPIGVINAFAEMLALSRTRMILASKDSTFSQVAAKMGEKPYEALSIYTT